MKNVYDYASWLRDLYYFLLKAEPDYPAGVERCMNSPRVKVYHQRGLAPKQAAGLLAEALKSVK